MDRRYEKKIISMDSDYDSRLMFIKVLNKKEKHVSAPHEYREEPIYVCEEKHTWVMREPDEEIIIRNERTNRREMRKNFQQRVHVNK